MCLKRCDVYIEPVVQQQHSGSTALVTWDNTRQPNDDSFADFLAREVHESAMDSSPSPPLTEQLSTGNGLRRFGVTASCPPAPLLLPDSALNAVSTHTSILLELGT